MSTLDAVDRYYDAWKNRRCDFSQVPLAADFEFVGPVASFSDAEGYRQMARDAGPLVRKFNVRHRFVAGDRVCSIIDWEMDLPVAPMTSAEILEIKDGEIVRGELIYDAEELRTVVRGTARPPNS